MNTRTSQQPPEPTMQVPVRLMQAIMNYLVNHPFNQVVGLISEIQKIQGPEALPPSRREADQARGLDS